MLPPDVASRIAAGEVVERPAAVVKELLDNALDAGGTRITVEVQEGGRRLIRVSDDGEGMARDDAPVAFQRYATSKVRSDLDLQSIRTLGFRGEAIPSIAAVSRMQLVTVQTGEMIGIELDVEGGEIQTSRDRSAPAGTTVTVRDLFYNTPARRKFLKTPATEFSHICQHVQQAALAWPSVQFRLVHNDQQVFDYPSVASLEDRLLQVYGARHLEQTIFIDVGDPEIRLTARVSKPTCVRAARGPQTIFVNRRAVKSSAVGHAIYDAYEGCLAKGHHPAYTVFLDLDPRRIDVNVHPSKREIRFADQARVHEVVRRGIRDAMRGHERGPKGTSAGPVDVAGEAPGQSDRQQGGLSGEEPLRRRPFLAGDSMRLYVPDQASGDPAQSVGDREDSAVYDHRGDQIWKEEVTPLGQINRTFLVVQVGSELQVIDQHTAHERVIFERLCRGWLNQDVATQALLIPETIELPLKDAVLLGECVSDLAKLGIEIEPFGGQSFVLRAVPAALGPIDYTALIQDLVEDLTQWKTLPALDTRVRPVLASLACHGAVRAGRPMALPEIGELVRDWAAEGFPETCPHGRRVALRFSSDELARIFGRA